MAEEYVLPQPETLSMSLAEADKLLAAGNGDAALLYLYILRNGGRLDPAEAAKRLRMEERLDEALSALAELGLVRAPAHREAAKPLPERGDQPPSYSIADVKRQAERRDDFRALLDETARRLGHVLSGNDMIILFGLYDDLNLPTEVILLLIGWCVQEQERRYGSEKKPSLKQIQKEAYIWAGKDIFTLDLAEAHILRLAEQRQSGAEVKRCLGIRDRPLTPTEEKYIFSWLELGFGTDAIEEAYDRTVLKKRNLVWPYLNRILESWHKKGLLTLEQIQAEDPRERGAKKTGGEARDNAPTAAEYERMQRFLDKLNGGNGNGT